MTNQTSVLNEDRAMYRQKKEARENLIFVSIARSGIWAVGIPSCVFGIGERTIASLANGYISILEIAQLFTTFFVFVSWLYLKPEVSLDSASGSSKSYQLDLPSEQLELYKSIIKNRILALQDRHKIRQIYILPFSHICQMYHLLNLKHLETIHGFSLNNLRIVKVSDVQPTLRGGIIKFQTVLDSPMNALRIWRQPIVEVNLILHTPYTVELSIPLYNDKNITVLFNAFPLSENEHQLFIDIYSNLEWPKPLLKLVLHFASSLTLFEDLPYLNKLAQRKTNRLVNLKNISKHETMWLYRRFVDLYGSSKASAQLPSSEYKA
ncbi:MAG: hypothetical protein ACRC06_00125 [Waterburya sp.]